VTPPADPIGPEALARAFVGRSNPARRPLVALDHDGTLAPIAATPDAAVLESGVREAITALTSHADVVILSGRGLDDLTERFAGLDVTIVSEHGLRARATDGRTRDLAASFPPGALATVRTQLSALLAGRPGWLVEDKSVSLAVHYRRVPDDGLGPMLLKVQHLLGDAVSSGGLDGVVQPGHAVLELRPSGADKGAALALLVEERDSAPVLMVGDDLTDESALALAETLGGLGVLVASGPRASAASARLEGPTQVVVLLREIARLLRRG
jgi:trehalose-phosphatase